MLSFYKAILLVYLFLVSPVIAFQRDSTLRGWVVRRTHTRGLLEGVQGLWEEIIEMSTYGPSERRILKARRLSNLEQQTTQLEDAEQSSSFDYDDLSVENFRSVADEMLAPDGREPLDFDGYALQDLLIEKWGIPLDIDFQRQQGLDGIYCTILPVAFGTRKCRHESELAYLMHLQAVVEILHKYDNLDLFVDFVRTTSKAPKVGTDSVPFRMQLTDEQLQKIL